MDSCCNSSYQNTFDHKRAQKELKAYEQTGVKANSRPLMDLIRSVDLRDSSMLEIGGGIGSLIFESFKLGLQKARYVDISKAYSDTFITALKEKGLTEKVDPRLGDFVELSADIPQVDLVVLDKVICCYENYEKLIQLSTSKSVKWYAITIPRDTWWVKMVHSFGNILRKLNKNPFQSFIHAHQDIFAVLEKEGFHIRKEKKRREWQSFLLERTY